MPSITYWNRLEPRSRTRDLTGALSARVRDPAWFLARQWQLGELQGEDAGSPAYVHVDATFTSFVGWQGRDAEPQPLAAGRPIEPQAVAEPFSSFDLSLSVELGQWLARIANGIAADLLSHWQAMWPVGDAAGPPDDPRTARLRELWRGRAIDGLAVYVAATGEQIPGSPPPGVPSTVPANRWAEASAILDELKLLVAELVGAIGDDDPAGWERERLDYSLRAFTGDPEEPALVRTLRVHPDAEGDLEWFAFDATDEEPPSGLPTPTAETVSRTVIPGPVRFRGMPTARFWNFEDGRVSFAAIQPDRRDLGSLVLMDFMLVHGNDWFLVPFEQPVGTRAQLGVTVVDVFGSPTPIERAEHYDVPQIPNPSGEKLWTMFSTTTPTGASTALLLPATAAPSVIDGEPVEEVRFLRDETANLAWAVEHAIESRLGRAWLGHERNSAGLPDEPEEVSATAPLLYRLQSRVPDNWFPFQAVNINTEEVPVNVLQRAALLRSVHEPPRQARGKIVGHQLDYRIRDEEIPREGRRVSRLARWARDPDGNAHLWMSRRRGIGTGEGWSGLRFDQAVAVTNLVEPDPDAPTTVLTWDTPPGWDESDWG
jgi:hypothetical protein